MSFPPIDEQLTILRRGTVEIVPDEELVEKLNNSLKTNTPLRIKLGCDPTRPDLHLGHSVILRKLRQFQDLGHQAILIIGDFTGMIGDPSGVNKTRPSLSHQAMRENAKTYYEQASRILDPEKTSIVYNSEWLGEMKFGDVIRLASRVTLARMIERDDFANRYAKEEPISMHEFLYPLAQGQDSVHLKSDVELGGTDQKFNLLVGRHLQRENGLPQQICLMMPLLIGTDGSQKMSKSYDNYIGLNDPPDDMYGKTLSIPDDLIYSYFELVTDAPVELLPEIKEKASIDPRNSKHDLAFTLTRMYHGEGAANQARDRFQKTVVNKEIPDEIPELVFEANSSQNLINIIKETGFAPSASEARRWVKQGGVSLDGEKMVDAGHEIHFKAGSEFILKVGKRKYCRLRTAYRVGR
ncbi:MAG: tyrosine--tRNA ligase [Balneolales bacterium]